ncbi:MAG TPA: hypothetical protein VHN98_04595 [Acidimicrobiales bacterium]|nr:hypothetical protein [Acidimicrobiales bacterium]
MRSWGFLLLLVAAGAFVVVNTRLAVTAETAEQERLALVGLLCEIVALAAVVASVLVG